MCHIAEISLVETNKNLVLFLSSAYSQGDHFVSSIFKFIVLDFIVLY